MAKKSYKAVCENKNENVNQGLVRFSIGATAVPAAEPGKPPQRAAKTVITFQFTDPKEVSGYEAGKSYTITVE